MLISSKKAKPFIETYRIMLDQIYGSHGLAILIHNINCHAVILTSCASWGRGLCRMKTSPRTMSTRTEQGCDYQTNVTLRQHQGTRFPPGRLDHCFSDCHVHVSHLGSWGGA